ncbi:MAG: dicarboxylate/amino acid:cation symporter [Planctomycetota bacterium]
MTDRNRRRLALHWKILIGLALGVVVGLGVNAVWTDQTWASMGVNDAGSFLSGGSPDGVNDDANAIAHAAGFTRNLMEFLGDLFMRGLRFIAVPIVLFSLAAGVASLNDTAKLGRVGGKTIGIYLATTAVAISVGLLLANLIGPGRGFPDDLRETIAAAEADNAAGKLTNAADQRSRSTWDILLDIVPSNPFGAMASGNTLQVVVVGLLVGVALTMLPRERARPLIVFFEGMTEVVIKIVHMVLMIAPFAVFALIVVVIADLGLEVLKSLARYAFVVVLGLSIMVFAVYPSVLRVLTPVRYRRFFRAISPAQLLAFSSSSSGATLPVTMECCEERLGVRERIGSFVLPIGATINMDGTALYQGVAAVFIAQAFGVPLTFGDQLTIVLTATLASIGTAAVPGVGIVMLIIVLQAVDMPAEAMTTGIAVILGVDRILDMCRTTCNVTGDCMVAAVVASTEGELLTEEQIERAFASGPLDEFTKEEEEREDALS